jgi:hypothetical protein
VISSEVTGSMRLFVRYLNWPTNLQGFSLALSNSGPITSQGLTLEMLALELSRNDGIPGVTTS